MRQVTRALFAGAIVVATGSTALAAPPSNPGDAKNCADFENWNVAQVWFDTYVTMYGDVARLDEDNDRIACEGLTGAPRSAPLPRAADGGYVLAAENGTVFGFGDMAPLSPSPRGPIVDIASSDSGGYRLLAASGAVYARGVPHLGQPALSASTGVAAAIASTSDGSGYWVFTTTGRAFAFGSARHHGDMGAVRLNGAIVAAAATPSGQGYWMVGSDGGIFSFGDAQFYGSTGDRTISAPVVHLIADPDGVGYWLIGSDGEVYPFSAADRGSIPEVLAPGVRLNQPIVGGLALGSGYLLVAADGGTFAFGSQPFLGSLGATPSSSPIVGIGARAGVGGSTPPGDEEPAPTTTAPGGSTTTTTDPAGGGDDEDPLDSDGDGLTDDEEALFGTNPNSFDTDGDGLDDGFEVSFGTNALHPDSDGGGTSDGIEVDVNGTDPLDPSDD